MMKSPCAEHPEEAGRMSLIHHRQEQSWQRLPGAKGQAAVFSPYAKGAEPESLPQGAQLLRLGVIPSV